MSISAKIIADSINPRGKRLTTFVVRFPRIVLAELNTHRALSKNSASSRAIPLKTMLEMVKNDPFIPIKFQKDHSGMQGVEYYIGEEHIKCVEDWLAARDAAVNSVNSFRLPVTKQLRNRILEPFLWHTVIISATDYENFFALRAHQDAEIHIEALAKVMLEEYNKSEPNKLSVGEWHIPFGDKIDEKRAMEAVGITDDGSDDFTSLQLCKVFTEAKKKISIARCARISYLNFEGKDDYVADIKLCNRLYQNIPRHLSPTEHVAQALDTDEYIGNFCGFKQQRKMFLDENLSDARVIKKL